MLTRQFIDRVRASTDLLSLVSEYTEVSPAGNRLWMARCPHPDHDDSTPSFRIRHNEDDTWSWWCGGCHCGKKDLKSDERNYGSDCFAFISWMSDYKGSEHKIGFYEAVRILAQRAGIPMEVEKYSWKYKQLSSIAKSRHKAVWAYDDVLNYLHARGLTDASIKSWMIGFSCQKEEGQFVDRITFPLFSKYKEVLGFSSRVLPGQDDNLPKYRNSQNSDWFNKGCYLYGLQNYDSGVKELRITEGAMDVVLGTQAGVKNLVGTLGTSFTQHHAVMIKNLGCVPCFCMDGDAAGQKGIRRAVSMLANIGVYSKVCILPDGMDMADLALKYREKLEDFISDHTMTYWQFLLKDTEQAFTNQLIQLREKVMPEVLKASQGAVGPEDRALMKSYVKERFGISL